MDAHYDLKDIFCTVLLDEKTMLDSTFVSYRRVKLSSVDSASGNIEKEQTPLYFVYLLKYLPTFFVEKLIVSSQYLTGFRHIISNRHQTWKETLLQVRC